MGLSNVIFHLVLCVAYARTPSLFAFVNIFVRFFPPQVRVEADHTVYGDECKFGGGKVLLFCRVFFFV